MTHSPQSTSIFLVILASVIRLGAEVWQNAAELVSGQLGTAHLLLLETIALGVALGFLVDIWRSPRVEDDSVARERALLEAEARARWEAEMRPYFRRAAEAEVRAQARREQEKQLRAAAAERDRGKYGMRKSGSSSPIPEDVPLSKPTTPTRGRFAAEAHPAARPGSDPSSS